MIPLPTSNDQKLDYDNTRKWNEYRRDSPWKQQVDMGNVRLALHNSASDHTVISKSNF